MGARGAMANKGRMGRRILLVSNQGEAYTQSETHVFLASQKRNQKRKKRKNAHTPTILIRIGVTSGFAAMSVETTLQRNAASIEQENTRAQKKNQCRFVSGVTPIVAAPFLAVSPGGLRLVGVAVQVLLLLQWSVTLSSHAPG